MIVWAILRNSLPLQLVALGLLAWGGLTANNWSQRRIGAASVTSKIEKKADESAKTSDAVRTDVAAGKRGKPDPNRVR